MVDLIKSIETPEEAIEVLNQLHAYVSNHVFEKEKRISNNDKVNATIMENLKWSGKAKQVDVQPNTTG